MSYQSTKPFSCTKTHSASFVLVAEHTVNSPI
jgi:hypothetical protein